MGFYDVRVMSETHSDIKALTPPEAFFRAVESIELQFDPGDLERLGQYLALLLETNRQFNLTRITDPDEAWLRLVADSLTLAPFITSADAMRVIDIGSGGGVPGLPLAIALPEVHFTLVESTGKKASFLEAVVGHLGLSNVAVINDRAETLGQDHHRHREHYDLAIARALGKLPVLLELTVPFVKIEGHVLAIKGEQAATEIEHAKQALYQLHCHVVDMVRSETGTICVFQKRRKTPRRYPRKPGEPKRMPLGMISPT